MNQKCTVWVAAILISSSVASAEPQLIGVDVATNTLIRINTTTGAGAPICSVGDVGIAGLTYDSADGIVYASSVSTDNLLRVDAATGATTVVGAIGVPLMESIEYDSLSNTLYGITSHSQTGGLYTINAATGQATLVGIHGVLTLDGLAFDAPNNTMYAFDTGPGARNLYKMNLVSGAPTVVGPLGAGSLPGVGAAYDPSLGLFVSDNHGDYDVNDRLFHVDTATGQATLIGNIGYGNVISLAFVPESAIPEPSAVLLLSFGATGLLSRRRGS